ncbi:MAG: divergent polysaccharide deacetylase family protein [Pseudomonadota bacterium]|nr:divergent polysaccharide deacetylase family protein [Pseudomonadota bacterium]
MDAVLPEREVVHAPVPVVIAVAPLPVPAPAPLTPPAGPRLAIVLDDMALDRAAFARANRLPPEISFALLPYAHGLQDQADAARARGRELLVHVPMEPQGNADPGPDALLVGLPRGELDRRLDAALASFSGHVGINNHMGSRFTADPAAMQWLMGRLRERAGELFLDSRTTADSRGYEAALAAGVPALQRQVFLDPDGTGAAAGDYLAKAVKIALAEGQAIAIGHPHDLTLSVLERFVAASDRPVRLVRLSDLLPARLSAER